MRKNIIKKRALSILLAGALTVTSFDIVTPISVYAEKGEGTVYASRSFDSSYDAQYAYSGDDLGCTYTPQATTFKVWSPEASAVKLCRYEKGNGGSVIEEVDMTKGDKGVWSTTIQGDIVNTYYTYKVTVGGSTREAVDIYAKAAGVNGDRAMVVDLDSTDPDNWDKNYQREKTNLSDIIVWEVHVRDFSIDVSSGVSEGNRGKYKAFTESTTVNGEGKVASCVDYLKELGVTHVQLMPMYDYASVDETNVTTSLGSNYNWGYDPENYNVPEGSYSSNPYDGNVRITEMKEMIQALHDAGIKVVMDVVYNHTYDTKDSNFNKIMPDYYYKINSDLSYNNQSGCGNATRSESAMYRKFMIDSLTYWAGEYNLDGFRFDLMGIHDVTTMNQIRSALDKKYGEDTIVLYGEGWTGDGNYDENSAHKANEAKLDDGIGYFNDQIRDALKGDHKFNGTIGLLQTNYYSGSYLEPGEKWPNNVFGGIMGSVGYTSGQWGMWRPFWSKSSNCSLSYASAHDNLTLWDKLTEGAGKQYSSTDEKLINMNRMAGGVILSSKGGVFMQAGEEFARTKNGDENSYNASDSVNKIDWNRVNTYSDIQKYYEGMIKIRKAFSGFRSITTRSSDNWNPNNNNLTWISKDEKGMIAFYETNSVAGEWNKAAVLINNATSEKSVTLSGSDKWVIVADGKTAGLENLKEVGSSVSVPAKSVVVAVPKDTFDACDVTANRPPVISADSSYEAAPGDSLSFTVKTTDPDGDSVTLTATGVPQGAVFSTTTGEFNWTNAVAGTYTLELSATDGKDTSKKNITITVKDKTEAAKESLQTELEKAKEKLETAKKDISGYGETAVEDLETVINDVTEFLKKTHTIQEYESKTEDIKAADSACYLKKVNPTVRVKAEGWSNPAVYIWKGSGTSVEKFTQDWPGTNLTDKDSEGWYVFDLPEGTEDYSVIVNDGVAGTSTQTADITGITGNAYLTVTSFTGKNCEYNKNVIPVGISLVPVDTTLISRAVSNAEKYIEQYKNVERVKEEYKILCEACDEAKKMMTLVPPSQVQINKSTRSVKEAVSNLLAAASSGGEETTTPRQDETTTPRQDETTTPTSGETTTPKQDETTTSKSDETTTLKQDETTTPETEKPTSVKPEETTKPKEENTTTDNTEKPTSVKPEETTIPKEEETTTGRAEETTVPGEEETTTNKPVQPSTEQKKELKITSLSAGTPSRVACAGDKVSFTVKSSGGVGKVQYRFYVKQKHTSIIRNYSTSKTARWIPDKSGKYTIVVMAKDSEGNTVTKNIKSYYVNAKLKVSTFKTSMASKKAIENKKIKLTMKAAGGTGRYQYRFVYKRKGEDTVHTISRYSSKKSVMWTPLKAGKYTLYAYVKDVKTNKVAKKTITSYEVKSK